MGREQDGAVAEFVEHLNTQIEILQGRENKTPCADCGMLTLLRIKRWELLNPPKGVSLKTIAAIATAAATFTAIIAKLLFK